MASPSANEQVRAAFARTQDARQLTDLLVEAVCELGSSSLAKQLNAVIDGWFGVVEVDGKRGLRPEMEAEELSEIVVDGDKPPSTTQTEGSEAANKREQKTVDKSDVEDPGHDPKVQDFSLRGGT